jgi:two-component system cell cycle sensor histidine kinase PleC
MLRELEESHAQLERQSFQLTRLANRAAEQQQTAEAASVAKSQFLANISHELRTPLNAILGFSEIMKSEMFGPLGSPQYRGYAADIHDSGSHLLTVINDILDLSKIEAGKFELNEEDCDVPRLVRDAVRFVAERADSAGLGLQQRLAPALPAVRADGRLIKQILLNLLSNAIKFSQAGGMVTVAAAIDREGGLSLTVADTGIGIAADQLERVLQPFTQVENTLTRTHAGTGLGLPLCKSLIELHGGRLVLESAVGRGTAVTIMLPKERILAAGPAASAA